MSELTFKSAGVGISEIDLSVKRSYPSTGVPACVIGTAKQGPAFVPQTIGSIGDFEKIFGSIDETQYGAIAVQQWLKNAGSATFVRVLGVGDGSTAANYSGFMVGDELPNIGDGGLLGVNPYAYASGDEGRTYVLGAFMTDNTDSTYLADTGLLDTTDTYESVADVAATVIFTLGDIAAPASGDTVVIETASFRWDDSATPEYETYTGVTSFSDLVDAINDDGVGVHTDGVTACDAFAAVYDSSSGTLEITQETVGTTGNNRVAEMTIGDAKLVPTVADTLAGGETLVDSFVVIDVEASAAAYALVATNTFSATDSEGTVHTFTAMPYSTTPATNEFVLADPVSPDIDADWEALATAMVTGIFLDDGTQAFSTVVYDDSGWSLTITQATGTGVTGDDKVCTSDITSATTDPSGIFGSGVDEAQDTITVDVSAASGDALPWASGDTLTLVVDGNTYTFEAYDSGAADPAPTPALGSSFDITGLSIFGQWVALRSLVNDTLTWKDATAEVAASVAIDVDDGGGTAWAFTADDIFTVTDAEGTVHTFTAMPNGTTPATNEFVLSDPVVIDDDWTALATAMVTDIFLEDGTTPAFSAVAYDSSAFTLTITQGVTGEIGNDKEVSSVIDSAGVSAPSGTFADGTNWVIAADHMTLSYSSTAYTMKFTMDDGEESAPSPTTVQFSLVSNAELAETFAGGVDADTTTAREVPIIRGMLMTPSGVLATLDNGTMSPLAESATELNIYNADGLNTLFGTLDSTNTFKIHLNGFDSDTADNELTVSLDPTNAAYVANVLNTDPLKLQEKGHLLYSHLPVDETQAYAADAGITDALGSASPGAIFLAPGKDGTRGDSGSLEDFSGRFNHPVSPWVVSQTYGSVQHQLFRFHHKNDGVLADEDMIRISISNLKPSTTGYPTFSISLQKFDGSTIANGIFSNLTLDPTSSNYIAKLIGDKHVYFNLDKATPQLADIGTYGNIDSPIRVEMAEKVSMSLTPQDALPFGHKAYSQLTTDILSESNYAGSTLDAAVSLTNAAELPVPFRMNILGNDDLASSDFDWGTQFTKIQDISSPNKSMVISDIIKNIAKYRPEALLTSSATYNNSDFTLERIEVDVTDTTDESAINWDSTSTVYRRNATRADSGTVTRFFSVDDLTTDTTTQNYAKFSMFLQGGFDGVNVFVEEKAKLMDTAIEWEYEDAVKQYAKNGPTSAAYRTALDVLSSKSDTDFNLLAMPGIRNVPTTKYAIDMVENRFDAMYIMDIAGYNNGAERISTLSADQIPNANLTASNFEGLSYDSSFVAAYFPDVTMNFNGSDTVVPASCAVLGAFAKNDSMAYSWFAPAGFTRGALSDVAETGVSFSRENLDNLYEAKINPITSFPGSAIVVWGQKTLLQAPSSLDRVNVRRLLIYIRRRVRAIALGFLFEPNREETLVKFEAAVTPLLQSVQENSGVERFKVKIDAETTTQIDVENNTLRGKIYLQPTLTAEFISLDFVVSNTIE